MNRIIKITAAATLTGAVALAMATPSQARHGWNAAAIGFGAGALVGAAAASAAYNNGYYYGDGYAYEPAYAYAPDYAYEPAYAYAPDYAYEPAYVAPYVYSYDSYYPSRWQDQHSTNNFTISSQR